MANTTGVPANQAPSRIVPQPMRNGGTELTLSNGLPAATGEVAVSRQVAEAAQEVQAAVVLARTFPRDEDLFYSRLMRTCERFSFADKATFTFPRGESEVEGPSVYLAREMARMWGNMHYGHRVLFEDETRLKIQGYAWDMESNSRVTEEQTVSKMVQRWTGKGNNRELIWREADEREKLELINRVGAKLSRNCILHLLPWDVVQDAMAACATTVAKNVKSDPEAIRKQLIISFGQLNITPVMLNEYLGHPVKTCSPDELNKLRQIWKAIYNGESTWSSYMEAAAEARKVAAAAAMGVETKKPDADTTTDQTVTTGEPAETDAPNTETTQASDEQILSPVPNGVKWSEFDMQGRQIVEAYLTREGFKTKAQREAYLAKYQGTAHDLLIAAEAVMLQGGGAQ